MDKTVRMSIAKNGNYLLIHTHKGIDFQEGTYKDEYSISRYLYQVMVTLHFLNDVANDAESTQKSKFTP